MLNPIQTGLFWSQIVLERGVESAPHPLPLHNFSIIQRIATKLGRISNWMGDLQIEALTLEGPGGSNGPPIGSLDLKFEAFKQSK